MIYDVIGWVRGGGDKRWGITHAVRHVSRFGAAHSDLQRVGIGKDKNWEYKRISVG